MVFHVLFYLLCWLGGESFKWLFFCFLLGGLLYVEPGLDMFSQL